MDEVDKILYRLGYYDSDENKKADIQSFVDEAVEFMLNSGVSKDKITGQRAFAIKSIWADLRDKGDNDNIIKQDGMIVALISQLRD